MVITFFGAESCSELRIRVRAVFIDVGNISEYEGVYSWGVCFNVQVGSETGRQGCIFKLFVVILRAVIPSLHW